MAQQQSTTDTTEPQEIWANYHLLAITRDGSEIWRDVIGAAGWYEVSNLGQVRSWIKKSPGKRRLLAAPIILAPSLNRQVQGYPCVTIVSEDGKRRFVPVSNLVAEAFIGPRPEPKRRWEAAHHDGDEANNRLDNVRWAELLVNAADKKRHGTISRGLRQFRMSGEVKMYRCTKCGQWKPASTGFYRLAENHPSVMKLHSECKKCGNKRRVDRRREIAQAAA